MISPNDIKVKAERKYLLYLQSLVQEIPFSKLIITGDKKPSQSLPELQKEILSLANQSKEKQGFGFSIDYQTIKTKTIGTQSLPVSIYFDSEKDFLKYLGKEKEVNDLRTNCKLISSKFPELKDWVLYNPLKVIQNQDKWEGILKVCDYFKNNPVPNLYIRELPIKVHTKFVETNQNIIRDLLDIIILPNVNQKEREFEKRFNLKFREPLVRFKILDKKISQSFFSGIDDISIPVSQFESLQLPVKRALIVENKTTLYTTLTLPKMDDTIAIFGQGNAVSNIQNTKWLNEVQLLYWGDIDVQGFEMLSRTRQHFQHTESVLMDDKTFEKYFENDFGKSSSSTVQLILTDIERDLYEKIKLNNWRLEQEKIPVEYINNFFNATILLNTYPNT